MIGRFERATHVESRLMMSVLIACICQFAERFAAAHRGGKLRAEGDSVNSSMARRGNELNLLVAASSDRSRFRAKIFSNALVLIFTGTRAFHFLSQENFFFAIENKIHFFLVGFATGF
jgi:hypothetical protein